MAISLFGGMPAHHTMEVSKMKKLLAGALAIALIIAISAFAVANNGEKTAAPSNTKFIMDGQEVSLDSAYLIDDSNYLQLRSVAELLRGTQSQFNVYWDDARGQAVIETGKAYTGDAPRATQNPAIPTADDVKSAISGIEGIMSVEIVTEDNDPNGSLGKQGGYIGCVYFKYSLVDESELYVEEGGDIASAIDCGTDGGGCIEIYANAADANIRNDYLASFDVGVFTSGSHIVLSTMVVRTSDLLTASEQQALEAKLIEALQ